MLSQPGPFRILGGDYTALAPNMASAFGIEDIRGYQSLYFERYNRLARLIDGKDFSRTGEGNVNLRAYFSQMSEEKLSEFKSTWTDEEVMAWDDNFRDDETLFLICSERDVNIEEYRRVLGEHIRFRFANKAQS